MTQNEKTIALRDGSQLLCMDSNRLDSQIALLADGKYFGVAVGRIHGYQLDDVDFLEKIPKVEAVHIQDEIEDLSGLNALTNVKYLLVTSPNRVIDIPEFPMLRELRIGGWNSNVKRINESSSLETLYIRGFSPKSEGLEILAPKSRLVDIEIVQSTLVSLDGLECFKDISFTAFRYFPNLIDISQLKYVSSSVRKLTLDHCKRIMDYTVIAELSALTNLSINSCGALESVAFVSRLKNLETIGLLGTSVQDGDLSHLVALPKLRFAGVSNKKHYTHKAAELKKILDARQQKSV